jgi:hypothetical protein
MWRHLAGEEFLPVFSTKIMAGENRWDKAGNPVLRSLYSIISFRIFSL